MAILFVHHTVVGQNGKPMLEQKVYVRCIVFLSLTHNCSESYFGVAVKYVSKLPFEPFRLTYLYKSYRIESYRILQHLFHPPPMFLIYTAIRWEYKKIMKKEITTRTNTYYALMHNHCHDVGLGKLTFTLRNVIYKTEASVFFPLFFFPFLSSYFRLFWCSTDFLCLLFILV